jgi:hypothetical protein
LTRPSQRLSTVLTSCAYQAKIVRQESQAIDAAFEKKIKGAETARKMCVSFCVEGRVD